MTNTTPSTSSSRSEMIKAPANSERPDRNRKRRTMNGFCVVLLVGRLAAGRRPHGDDDGAHQGRPTAAVRLGRLAPVHTRIRIGTVA